MKIKHIVYNEHFLFSKNDLWGRKTGGVVRHFVTVTVL